MKQLPIEYNSFSAYIGTIFLIMSNIVVHLNAALESDTLTLMVAVHSENDALVLRMTDALMGLNEMGIL